MWLLRFALLVIASFAEDAPLIEQGSGQQTIVQRPGSGRAPGRGGLPTVPPPGGGRGPGRGKLPTTSPGTNTTEPPERSSRRRKGDTRRRSSRRRTSGRRRKSAPYQPTFRRRMHFVYDDTWSESAKKVIKDLESQLSCVSRRELDTCYIIDGHQNTTGSCRRLMKQPTPGQADLLCRPGNSSEIQLGSSRGSQMLLAGRRRRRRSSPSSSAPSSARRRRRAISARRRGFGWSEQWSQSAANAISRLESRVACLHRKARDQCDYMDGGTNKSGLCYFIGTYKPPAPGRVRFHCRPWVKPVIECWGKKNGDKCNTTYFEHKQVGICEPYAMDKTKMYCVSLPTESPNVKVCAGKEEMAHCTYSVVGKTYYGNCIKRHMGKYGWGKFCTETKDSIRRRRRRRK